MEQSKNLMRYVATLTLDSKSNKAHNLLKERFLPTFGGVRKTRLFLIYHPTNVKLYCKALKKILRNVPKQNEELILKL
jgi:hypothetical protein